HAEPDLAAFERDLVRREFKSLRGDRHLARRWILRVNPKSSDDDGEDENCGPFHKKAPGFEICWTPSVPPNSRRVSSTSSMENCGPLRAATRCSPRFWNGFSLSNGIGFLSPDVVGSGKAKISDRDA